MKITFICCCNNKQELDSMLLPSFNLMDKSICNLILIDAKQENFKSAAEAYNKTIERRKNEIGDILVFCHQDIAFDNSDFLKNIVSELTRDKNQILGFAGLFNEGPVISNLRYYKNKSYITGIQIKEKTEVYSLDECCFAMDKSIYERFLFNEKICNHWHLYATEFCYNARLHGITSYVMPDTIYHKKEKGCGLSTDRHFLATMWRLTQKYRKHFDSIYTTSYNRCKTNPIFAGARIVRTTLGNFYRLCKSHL